MQIKEQDNIYDAQYISSFHMLGNEPEILDFKFEDDPTLNL